MRVLCDVWWVSDSTRLRAGDRIYLPERGDAVRLVTKLSGIAQ